MRTCGYYNFLLAFILQRNRRFKLYYRCMYGQCIYGTLYSVGFDDWFSHCILDSMIGGGVLDLELFYFFCLVLLWLILLMCQHTPLGQELIKLVSYLDIWG